MASRTDYATTLRNFQAVEELLKNQAKVVLTCRTHYFKDQNELHTVHKGTQLYQRSRECGYELVFLQGLEEEEIKEYVQKTCGTKWKDFYERIRATYNLLALANRPILLEMITAILPKLCTFRNFL
jgi:hypothetical protein